MTNQPLQNGYTQVPDDFMAAVIRINLSAYESRVFWCVVQKTIRYHKATDRISFSQFFELTKIKKVHIGRALEHLIGRHVVLCIGTGYKLEYGINTNYEEWLESLPKEVTKPPSTKKTGYQKYQLRLLPKEVTDNTERASGYWLKDGSGPFDTVQAAMEALGLDPKNRPQHNRWDRLAKSLREQIFPNKPSEVTNSLPGEVTPSDGKSLPGEIIPLPIQDVPLPKEVTKSLPIQVTTLESRDITLKNNIKEDGGKSSSAATPTSLYLFEKTGRKHWANKVQKEQFEACEKEVGPEIMRAAVDWALTSGIANIKSMITTARKKKREGERHVNRQPAGDIGRPHGSYQRPPHKAQPAAEEYDPRDKAWRERQGAEG